MFDKTLKAIMAQLNVFKLEHKGIEFYLDRAPKTATLPYVVYGLEDMLDTLPTYNSTLYFSVFDSENKSSQTIRNTADAINDFFNNKVLASNQGTLHSKLTIYQNIPSEYLEQKQCIELQFDVRIY